MTIQYEPPRRYIVDTKTNDMLTNMSLARIEPTREFTANDFVGEQSPYNVQLNSEVNYSPKVESNLVKRIAPTKYSNNHPQESISLFEPRIQNVDGIRMKQAHELEAKAQHNRVQMLNNNADLDAINGDLVGNGFIYNPYLPESETNKRPSNYQTHRVDERFTYHTNDRPFNYVEDRAKIADDLRHSKDLIERNKRQAEADDALNHRVHHDRNYDHSQKYLNIGESKALHSFSRDEIRQASAQNDRNQMPNYKQKESFANMRPNFRESDVKTDAANISRNFTTFDYTKPIFNSTDPREHQYKSETTIKKHSHNLLDEFANYLFDVVTGAFNWNKREQKPTNIKQDLMANGVFVSDDPTVRPIDNTNVDTGRDLTLAKSQFNREDHMLVIKNGQTMTAYPDEDHSNTAVSFMNSDSELGIKRHIVFIDNGKFVVAQKLHKDAIFNGEKINDDVIIVELPIDSIDSKVRERIQKLNLGTKRDKVLELTYNDFVYFTEYLVKYPELQQRLKNEQLHFRLRGNNYDEEIANNFEGRKTFTDNTVYNNLTENAREHTIQYRKGRVEKDIEPFTIASNNSPFKNINLKRDSKPDGKLFLPRNVGLKRGQFD